MKHLVLSALLVTTSPVFGTTQAGAGPSAIVGPNSVVVASSGVDDGVVAAQVKAWVARMTPEEKVAQLTGTWITPYRQKRTSPKSLMEGRKFSPEKARRNIPDGVGYVSDISSTDDLNPDELVAFIRDLQTWLKKETRLGIPAILCDEAITGLAARGVTTLPQVIGVSCAWNPDLVEANAAGTRRLMRSIGVHQVLSPMSDVCRDARWGRMEESYGEDSYLTTRMVTAFVRGLRGENPEEGVVATIKHFAGYGLGDSVDSRAKSPAITEGGSAPPMMRAFFDETLRTFEAEIRVGGALSAMTSYGNFGGQKCSASKELLDDILRKRLGFGEGVIVSDFGAVEQINKDPVLAAAAAINAGVDVCLPDGVAFRTGLPEALRRGLVSAATIDRAVTRVLTLKARLGLLKPDPRLFAETTPDFNSPESQARALETALQSVVLLKNESGTLPLSKNLRSVLVTGPSAAFVDALLGDYTYQTLANFWWSIPIDATSPKLITFTEGLKNKLPPDCKLTSLRGCDWTRPLGAEADEAVRVAAQSDLVIIACGDNRHTCGESTGSANSALPGQQEAFIRKVAAAGKPIVLVDFGGRPHALESVEPLCRAIVAAWHPGEKGGDAVAALLTGEATPTGKLTCSFPRTNAQCPIRYGQTDKPYRPLYPFGHGLSYTRFAYAGMEAPAKVGTTARDATVSFTVENIGARDGVEIAQLYAGAVNPPSPRPSRELIGFARVPLKAGEKRRVSIRVPLALFASHDEKLRFALNPGVFRLELGASATDIKATTDLALEGEKQVFPHRDIFFSETP